MVSTSAMSALIDASKSLRRTVANAHGRVTPVTLWERIYGFSRSPVQLGPNSGSSSRVGCRPPPTRPDARRPRTRSQQALPRSQSRSCIPRFIEAGCRPDDDAYWLADREGPRIGRDMCRDCLVEKHRVRRRAVRIRARMMASRWRRLDHEVRKHAGKRSRQLNRPGLGRVTPVTFQEMY
jgi:hypothetical protein